MTTLTLNPPATDEGFFRKSEIIFMGIIGFVLIANLIVDMQGPQRIGWSTFALPIAAGGTLIVLGAYYRFAYKGVAWLGKSALTIALACFLGMMMGILFHQQMPRPEPVLTEALLAMDRWFGFYWPDAVAWTAEVPGLGFFLRQVYLSSFFQIMLLVVVLAYMKRDRVLDAMMYTNGLALIIVYVVWQALPNLSQSTYLPIPPEQAEAVHLLTDSVYGGLLLEMAQNGLPVVTMDSIMGAVAFPSYHSVMWALVVVFAWRTPLFWPYLVINIIMVPAILVHGAHHVADILGGLAVMLVAMIPAYLICNACHRTD